MYIYTVPHILWTAVESSVILVCLSVGRFRGEFSHYIHCDQGTVSSSSSIVLCAHHSCHYTGLSWVGTKLDFWVVHKKI